MQKGDACAGPDASPVMIPGRAKPFSAVMGDAVPRAGAGQRTLTTFQRRRLKSAVSALQTALYRAGRPGAQRLSERRHQHNATL